MKRQRPKHPEWPATKALSVYNMLSVEGRDMRFDEIGSKLRQYWSKRVDSEYVSEGVAFLAARGLVGFDGETVRVKHQRDPRTGATPRLMKTRDERELVIYPTRPGLTWSNVQAGVRVS